VVYGIEDFKCHSKICLISMRDKGKLSYITQLGTGIYNEKTNAMYTDLSVITASDAIGEEGTAFSAICWLTIPKEYISSCL
jgi:polyphosphate kinase